MDMFGADVLTLQEARVREGRARSIAKRWSFEETAIEWGPRTTQLR